jgi:hypothetical protein
VAATLSISDDAHVVSMLVGHTVLTHHNCLVVLYSVVHGLLVRHLLLLLQQDRSKGEAFVTMMATWLRNVCMPLWTKWCTVEACGEKDTVCRAWLTQSRLSQDEQALSALCDTVCVQLKGFDELNPYWLDYASDSGWCVKSMRIALWAVHWSEQSAERTIEPLPEWAQGDNGNKYRWVLHERGFDAIRMISLIGADSDTYAAIAGPLLAAKFPNQVSESTLTLAPSALHINMQMLMSCTTAIVCHDLFPVFLSSPPRCWHHPMHSSCAKMLQSRLNRRSHSCMQPTEMK